MSGFVALFDRTQSGISQDQLRKMNQAIRHRGPDGTNRWCDVAVGFGHQLLQSTPESRFDTQPYRADGVVITGDVRIDNRAELFEQLSVSRQPHKVPDSQLLVDAYHEWGTDCVSHVYGAFSFVIWDDEKSRLFVARDRFGVKPLYYYLDSDTFAAASEKKALLTLPAVSGTVDETKIGDFLINLYEDKERTFFESLNRLPPAQTMVVESTETRRQQYWDLDPTRTVTLESDAAYERRFRELIEQAVQSRLRRLGPIGTSLSGGMDSSSVTVTARHLLPKSETLHTFSNVYDEAPSSDEREFIETVVTRPGIESHYTFPEEAQAILGHDEMTYLDQPPHNTMHFAVRERIRQAAENDVCALLGGELGDDSIGYGLGLLPELFWTGRWPSLYDELQAMAAVADTTVGHLFKRLVLTNFIPEPVSRWRQQFRGEYDPVADENWTLDPAFVARIGLQKRYEDLRLRGSSVAPRARRLQRRSLLTGKTATNFEVLDQIHAAYGIEPRYPFADARLVEFSLAMPATQQFANGYTRSIIRRSLGDLLPEAIQWRPWKTAVSEAFWNALSAERNRVNRLYESPGQLSRYVEPGALETAHRSFKDKPNSHDARPLWQALSLATWVAAYGSTDTDTQAAQARFVEP